MITGKESYSVRISPLPDGPYLVLSPDFDAMWTAMGGTLLLGLEKGIAVHILGPWNPKESKILDRFVRLAENRFSACKINSIGLSKNNPMSVDSLGRIVGDAVCSLHFKTVFLPEIWAAEGIDDAFHAVGLISYFEKKGLKADFFQYGLRDKSLGNRRVNIQAATKWKSKLHGSDTDTSGHRKDKSLESSGKTPTEIFRADFLLTIPGAWLPIENAAAKKGISKPVLILDDGSLLGRLAEASAENLRLSGHLQSAKRETAAIMGSLSWRLTRPVRVIKQIISGKSDPSDSLFLRGIVFLRNHGLVKTISQIRLRRSINQTFRRLNQRLPRPEFHLENLKNTPLISILVPVYNPPVGFLSACLDSVLAQTYPHWELCITDDASTDPNIKSLLEKYREKRPDKIRLFFHEKNQHICVATNSCLKMARGSFVGLLDHDDLLTKDALMAVAHWINQYPNADMIYSDEDKVDEKGEKCDPFFKPDWSPELLKGQMYTCHLSVYRKQLVDDLGGFRQGFEGAQDHDLALRISAKTRNIYHIPHILYHWRKSKVSCSQNPDSKAYAYKAGLKAVNEALELEGEGGRAEPVGDSPGCYLVHYPPKKGAYVTILIPTRDQHLFLERCLSSIYRYAGDDDWEVRIIDNGSEHRETFELFDRWDRILGNRFHVLRVDAPFNFSMLNNQGAKLANGNLLLLLNNDTEALTPRWTAEMAGYAMRRQIGAVGSFLLYPDGTVQHAGVVLGITGTPGMKGVAGHSHKYFPGSSKGYFSRLKIVSNYSAVTGACLMVETDVFHAVGGMNENLSVAFNDVDFCLKLVDKGYRNVVLPHVSFVHHESKSRGYEDNPEKQTRFAQEIRIMLDTWGDRLEKDAFYNPNLTLWREDFNIKCEKELLSCNLKN